jgi:hypothetical protein
MTIQFCSVRRRLGRHIVIFQIPGHHLAQRRVIVNDNDMAAIREHELNSQFSSLSGVVSI